MRKTGDMAGLVAAFANGPCGIGFLVYEMMGVRTKICAVLLIIRAT